MVTPINLNIYEELIEMYDKCSSLIRAVSYHMDQTDLTKYRILRAEIIELKDKFDRIIIEMDAFEQNNLGRK